MFVFNNAIIMFSGFAFIFLRCFNKIDFAETGYK